MTDSPSPRAMWEQRYGTDEYVYGTEPNDFLRSSLPTLPTGVAMCLAEGEGRNSVFLAEFDLGDGRWDLVVSILAHMPPAVRRDLHRRVVASLKPGGVLLLEAYTPAQIGRGTGGPQSTELTMTLESLRDELAPLEFVHADELERTIVEGPGHTGTGAVVQLIARRPS